MSKGQINEAMRLRIQDRIDEGLKIVETGRWRDYGAAIREGYKMKNGRAIPTEILASCGIVLENTRRMMGRMDETTRQANLGTFNDYGFEIISAAMPNFIAHELCSVQPLHARTGQIFFLNYQYGSTKGNIKAGDVAIGAKTGFGNQMNFTGEKVESESIGTGDASKVNFKTTLFYYPLRPGTVTVTAGAVSVVDDGNGGFSGAIDGTIDYATGAIDVTFDAAPAADVPVTATYDWNMNESEIGIPQVDLDLDQETIEARPRKLRARWLFDVANDLEQEQGKNVDDLLVTTMASLVKHEIDANVITKQYQGAGLTGYEFDCAVPQAIAKPIHFATFKIKLAKMSNDIFVATKRSGATFIVGGVNVLTLLMGIGQVGGFIPAPDIDKPCNGPRYVGTLDGQYRCYINPFMNADAFYIGFRGADWIDAGYVFAPYLPLYTTPPVILDDFIVRRGCATSYGEKMINNNLFAKGTLKNALANF